MSYSAFKYNYLSNDLVAHTPATAGGTANNTFAPAPRIVMPANDPANIAKYTIGPNESIVTQYINKAEWYQVNPNTAQNYSEYNPNAIKEQEAELKRQTEKDSNKTAGTEKTDIMEYAKWGAIGAGTLILLAIIFK